MRSRLPLGIGAYGGSIGLQGNDVWDLFPFIIFILILYKLMPIAFANPVRLIYFSRILLPKFFHPICSPGAPWNSPIYLHEMPWDRLIEIALWPLQVSEL